MKVWKQLNREGIFVARCTAERLMRGVGPRGAGRAERSRPPRSLTELAERPMDLVERQFTASRPNEL